MDSILHFDEINLSDEAQMGLQNQKQKNNSPFLGLVRMYENDKLNTDDSEDGWLTNMTVGVGREFAAQSVFKMAGTNTTLGGDISNYRVDGFGIGSGGSSIDSNDNVTFTGPNVCDIGLYSPLVINSSAVASTDDSGSTVDNTVKPIQTDGSIDFVLPTSGDISNCGVDYYTIVKNTCVINDTEPTAASSGAVRVDEAMLFARNDTGGDARPFAHITFSPKFVEQSTTFTIEWFVIF